jgi:hypothetical protein
MATGEIAHGSIHLLIYTLADQRNEIRPPMNEGQRNDHRSTDIDIDCAQDCVMVPLFRLRDFECRNDDGLICDVNKPTANIPTTDSSDLRP